ncbi:MAG TPA: hypothetical protein P5110_08415 [Candidatus Omnitrophota bacterium]|nr:hypothetical protein [Candidatus Omnitrophota bacterium]HRZ15512.1 hypothetical protein [Candidatus Omnitrophota bacterium]
MKQRILMIAVMLLIVLLSFVFAQENTQNQTQTQSQSGMMGQGMMGQGMMNRKMMDRDIMSSMMEKKIVATNDGGVVVWIGNKLFKYDKELKLVKETEIKIDMPKMQEKMGCAGGEFQPPERYHQSQGY